MVHLPSATKCVKSGNKYRLLYRAIPCRTTPYHVMPYDIIPYHSIPTSISSTFVFTRSQVNMLACRCIFDWRCVHLYRPDHLIEIPEPIERLLGEYAAALGRTFQQQKGVLTGCTGRHARGGQQTVRRKRRCKLSSYC